MGEGVVGNGSGVQWSQSACWKSRHHRATLESSGEPVMKQPDFLDLLPTCSLLFDPADRGDPTPLVANGEGGGIGSVVVVKFLLA